MTRRAPTSAAADGGPRRRRLDVLGVVALLLSLVPLTSSPSAASTSTSRTQVGGERTGVELELAPGAARAGETVQVRLRVAGATQPAAETRIELQRLDVTGWRHHSWLFPDASGAATASLKVAAAGDDNRIRARIDAPDVTGVWVEGRLGLVATPSLVTLTAPARVVDGAHVRLGLAWRTAHVSGVPERAVIGTVAVQRRVRRAGAWGAWSTFATVTTDGAGRASLRVRPRLDHRWRAVTRPTEWTNAPRSAVLTMRNVAPGKKVRMPAGAPRPRITLPPQRRADTPGAAVTVQRIPNAVWRTMRGVSWQPGCPIGRDQLRLVETNYYAFDGYRRRGRVVVAATVVDNFVGAFRDLHAARVPIRSMRLPDRFGRSARLGGADDLRSMAADNTSVFNCRGVVGQPHRKSPHAWGRSLDLNPWENPFRSAWGVVPNRWWESRAHRDVAWRTSRHRVVRILARNGFRWTYGHGDLHHFDAVPQTP